MERLRRFGPFVTIALAAVVTLLGCVVPLAGAQSLHQQLERAEKLRLVQETLDRFGRVDIELNRLEKVFITDPELTAAIVRFRKAGYEALLQLKEMNSVPYFRAGEAERLRFWRDLLEEFEKLLATARRNMAPEH